CFCELSRLSVDLLEHSFVVFLFFFFFNDTATTEIYTLSLHDALPIWVGTIGVVRVDRSAGEDFGGETLMCSSQPSGRPASTPSIPPARVPVRSGFQPAAGLLPGVSPQAEERRLERRRQAESLAPHGRGLSCVHGRTHTSDSVR